MADPQRRGTTLRHESVIRRENTRERNTARESVYPAMSAAAQFSAITLIGTTATESTSGFKNPYVLQSESFLDRAGIILGLLLCQVAG